MTYLRELSLHWRPLAAASLGLVAGTISNYVGNLFAPYLVRDFGWSKAQFALIGLTVVIAAICLPVVGHLVDRHGMRRIAAVGVTLLPVIFAGLGLQQGSFGIFFALSLGQMLVVSALAGIVVYNRLIVRSFDRARGLALGIASCAPAVAAAAGSPLLSTFIDDHGWRAGYFLMAALTALAGGAALALVPRTFQDRNVPAKVAEEQPDGLKNLLGNRSFLVIFSAMLLCNLHFTMQTSQLKLVIAELGIRFETGSAMVSAFAIGVILGRIACGIALDRFAPRLVASCCFLIPSLGLALLASGAGGSVPMVAIAVTTLGFSVGAEGDIAAYLVARYFPPHQFSTVLGLVAAAMAISALAGTIILSRTVALTGSYNLFLGIAATTMALGSLSFLVLRPAENCGGRSCGSASCVPDAA